MSQVQFPKNPSAQQLFEILRGEFDRLPEGTLIRITLPDGYYTHLERPDSNGLFKAVIGKWRGWTFSAPGKTLVKAMELLEAKVQANPDPGTK